MPLSIDTQQAAAAEDVPVPEPEVCHALVPSAALPSHGGSLAPLPLV